MEGYLNTTAAAGLFLFAGTEVAGDALLLSTVEIISKFGVVAVLWFWVNKLNKQMDQQQKHHAKEREKDAKAREAERDTDRTDREKDRVFMRELFDDYKNRIDKIK